MMIHDDRLDWAMGELLAYGTLVTDGHPVRVSGQDSERGTFAHRHAAFVIEGTEDKYYPLQHVAENQAPFSVYNSLLSEYAVSVLSTVIRWHSPTDSRFGKHSLAIFTTWHR